MNIWECLRRCLKVFLIYLIIFPSLGLKSKSFAKILAQNLQCLCMWCSTSYMILVAFLVVISFRKLPQNIEFTFFSLCSNGVHLIFCFGCTLSNIQHPIIMNFKKFLCDYFAGLDLEFIYSLFNLKFLNQEFNMHSFDLKLMVQLKI